MCGKKGRPLRGLAASSLPILSRGYMKVYRKKLGAFLVAPIMRIIVFWGGNYHTGMMEN